MNHRIRNVAFALAVSAILAGFVVIGGNRNDARAAATSTTTGAMSGMQMPSAPAMDSNGHAAAVMAFHDAMRKLWEDHITWTRLFIVSDVPNVSGVDTLPDIDATTARLLQNQTDIGDAIKPFYGEAAGSALTALLRDHILQAAGILAAAKTGDPTLNAKIDAWYVNANDIAVFLHNANPQNWSLADMQKMMKTHLDLTLQEAVARLQGRYTDEVAAYDAVHAEILQMSDMLSSGIVAQFPAQFH